MARLRNPFLLFGAVFLLVTAVAAGAEPRATPESEPGCRYLEAGPPGPRGNALLVDSEVHHIALRRQGEAILVIFVHPRGEPALDCEGPAASVRNVDRIVYTPPAVRHVSHRLTVDGSGGLLGPGASPEPGGAEVEIAARFPEEPGDAWSSIFVTGTAGADRIRIGGLRDGRTGVNLDLVHDREHPDVDLFVDAAKKAHFQLDGGLGDDRLTASGRGSEFAGPMWQWGLSLRGDEGHDLVVGGPQRDVVRGDEGEDHVYGRGGDDRLDGDEGDDRVYGGPGDDEVGGGLDEGEPFHDLLSGGPGHDALRAIDGNRDEVLCGAGPDQAYLDQVDDWSRATCEKQHGPDFPR